MVDYNIASAKIALKASSLRTSDEYTTLLKGLNMLQRIDGVKYEIDSMKKNLSEQDKSYYTGFVSALSIVEGMIAEMELESSKNCF